MKHSTNKDTLIVHSHQPPACLLRQTRNGTIPVMLHMSQAATASPLTIGQTADPPPTTFSRPARRYGWIGLVLLFIVLLSCGRLGTTRTGPFGDRARVIRIVDGDTIVVTINGRSETVRYVGIDTPERGQPGYRAATEANRDLVGGQSIYLRRDISERDAFGRLLRYIYLEDGTLVNRELIAQGWAQPVEYPPDTRHAAEFRRAAQTAAQEGLGFWSGDSPYDGAMSYGVVKRSADMRRGPSTEYDVVSRVEPGTILTIFGRSPNSRWLQVRLPDLEGGWLSVGSVDANVPIATIPLGELDGVVLGSGPESIVVTPAATSQARCPMGCEAQPDPTCFIKGNVSSSGERIYHLPGGSFYSRTQIHPDEGDRWFCTTVEAETNGFRAALR